MDDLDSKTQGTFLVPCKRRKIDHRRPRTESRSAEAIKAFSRRALKENWIRIESSIESTMARITKGTFQTLYQFVQDCSLARDPDELPPSYPQIPTTLISSTSNPTLRSIISLLYLRLERSNIRPDQDVEMLNLPSSSSSFTRVFRTVLVECRPTSSLEVLVETIVIGLLKGQQPDGVPNLFMLANNLPTECKPVITLHQIHLLPTSVLSSFLHCLARYAPQLGFVLLMTASTATGVLREVLPASVRSHLDLRTLDLMDGEEIWENIMSDLLFSPKSDLHVLIGGDLFDELRTAYLQDDGSLECFLSSLQYINLRSYTAPLGMLIPPFDKTCLPPLPRTTMEADEIRDRLLCLLPDRVYDPQIKLPQVLAIGPSHPTLKELISWVEIQRRQVMSHAEDVRLAYHLISVIQGFLLGKAKVDDFNLDVPIVKLGVKDRRQLMKDCLTGRCSRLDVDLQRIGQFPTNLLGPLNQSFKTALDLFGPYKSEYRSKLATSLGGIGVPDGTETSAAQVIPTALRSFFSGVFSRNQKILFHEIFYSTALDDMVKVFRPSPLEAIQTALLSPYVYFQLSNPFLKPSSNPADAPDTSILFTKYLESGKIINLYDWFVTFAQVLGVDVSTPLQSYGSDREEEDRKRKDCQVRFLRSFHELDFLGFLKGTRRKEDHCLKTFFSLTEIENGEVGLGGDRVDY
ncbi:Origin recognition complex, subunit 3 [Phaffia rhodozyma]|uniref:Origin recognition complex, subunit 3 n=1 Tax=Phaffia rhodozyma TaxID=264483 RepID=A0A0F7SF74_PHARH|nr:Origin recognition complex, subunit 3 [Phaffia rhodozyma]